MKQRETELSKVIRSRFAGAADFVEHPLRLGTVDAAAFFVDGLTSGSEIAEFVIQPMVGSLRGSSREMIRQCLDGTVWSAVAKEVTDGESACTLLVNGFCVVTFAGEPTAVAFEAKTGEKRGISPPDVENTVKGPKDAFTETVRTNTSLIRRHLRSPDLRLHETVVGRRSLTNITIVWLEGITNPWLVERMRRRVASIDVDGVLTPAAVEEYVTGSRPTAFPLLHYTERTDKFCRGILDGKVGLLVDGLPLGYLAPADLPGFLVSPEDQGVDYVSASCARVLRYLALLISLLLPGLFVAMAAFHQEMIPTKLLQSIIETKQQVPFPTVLEIMALLAAFEILQEAGLHLPKGLGQTVSIIGGLVVGTAAVEAKLISPAALIVVSTAGISGFAIPGRELAAAIRLWRFVLTAGAAVGGLFGLTAALIGLLLRLGGLSSFGLAYLRPFDRAETGGVIFRRRLIKEKFRDRGLRPRDIRKQR